MTTFSAWRAFGDPKRSLRWLCGEMAHWLLSDFRLPPMSTCFSAPRKSCLRRGATQERIAWLWSVCFSLKTQQAEFVGFTVSPFFSILIFVARALSPDRDTSDVQEKLTPGMGWERGVRTNPYQTEKPSRTPWVLLQNIMATPHGGRSGHGNAICAGRSL